MPKVYLANAARQEAAAKKRNKLLADHLRAYRARERISQDVLVQRMGVSRGVISRLENEKLELVESATVFAAVQATKLPTELWLTIGGYLLAVDRGHSEEICEWCGEKFFDSSGQRRRYCSRSCSISARYTQQGVRRGKRRISADSLEEWKGNLTQAARAECAGKRGKRVRLVCGTTSMYTGLDGLMAIVRYHLKLDPCDGSVYAFRDGTGSMLKYIEWDGQSFRQGKRRAQSGRYPWLRAKRGKR